jgi:hypothetical protein
VGLRDVEPDSRKRRAERAVSDDADDGRLVGGVWESVGGLLPYCTSTVVERVGGRRHSLRCGHEIRDGAA